MPRHKPSIAQNIESARKSFERDLLTSSYAQIISDEAHLANIIRHCDLISSKTYLDIGTGSGYIAFELARRDPSIFVIGVDIVEPVIAANNQKARAEHHSRLNFVGFGGTTLPFEDRAFGGVLSHYAFHHFPLPDLSTREIYRILEPQGLCIISDPIADIRDDMDFVNQFGALRNDGHICYYGEARLIELFEKAGLRVDTKFYSTITFPREFNEYYEKLLRKTPQALLDVYQVSQVGEKVHITLQVLNICFRKAASVV